MQSKGPLDDIGRTLLAALERDARLSFAELGRLVGLSPPAVADRVRRLEDQGIVTGYRAVIDRARLGQAITAFVRLRTTPEHYPAVRRLAGSCRDIVECHHLTGDDAFILKVAAASMAEIDTLITRLGTLGATSTAIVLSTLVADREATEA